MSLRTLSYLEFLPTIVVPLLKSAGIAGSVAAIWSLYALMHVLMLLLKEGLCNPNVNVLPGQWLAQRSLSITVEGGIKPRLFESA